MKENFKTFIKEIITVVVGILIALYINNWNEDRKDLKYVNRIFSSIKKELTETNEDIINQLPVQKSFIDTLDIYLNDNETSIQSIVIKAKGINVPAIRLNSWKALSNSKIELFDYDKISVLSNIEVGKDLLRMKAEKTVDFVYSNANETKRDKKELMRLLLMDIIGEELSIQKDIEKVIND